MSIEGDLRFLSHHETLRGLERIAARAELPLRYSQGFNPRPAMSVVCPRPVGVAARADLLVIALQEDLDPDVLLRRLNEQAPKGMRLLSARRLEGRRAPRVWKARYELRVDPDRLRGTEDRLRFLRDQDRWPVARLTRSKRSRTRRKVWEPQEIDVRPLVVGLELESGLLRLDLIRRGDLWARPSEVLRLLGLDERVDLGGLVRTALEFQE